MFRLWHFTSKFACERIQVGGFRAMTGRPICFSLPGERHWENGRGPALVEVWFDFDDEELAGYRLATMHGGRTIPFYSIPADDINARARHMRFHENADRFPTVAQDPQE